jgi:2-methylisocitrate lyase-like PEP mutase family enzyme
MTSTSDRRAAFRAFHTSPPDEPTPGILVLPNPWDVGSAKLLIALGARALATTSAGYAGANGRPDQNVQREQVLTHVAELTAAVDVPINVDSEDCFAETPEGVAETASLIAATAAAGFSIEDYDPRTDSIRSIGDAVERVVAAKSGGRDLVLTARAENYLHGVTDLDDTITRLIAYRNAGADVLYAPGLKDPADIRRVVEAVEVPLNVLAMPGTPSIPELAALGIARVSTGSMLAWAAYGAMVDATCEIFGPGTHAYAAHLLDAGLRNAAFTAPNPNLV